MIRLPRDVGLSCLRQASSALTGEHVGESDHKRSVSMMDQVM